MASAGLVKKNGGSKPFGLRYRPHFSGVVGVVSANAKNAANGKQLAGADNGQRRLRWRRENGIHEQSFH
jgi:hypothetical protein